MLAACENTTALFLVEKSPQAPKTRTGRHSFAASHALAFANIKSGRVIASLAKTVALGRRQHEVQVPACAAAGAAVLSCCCVATAAARSCPLGVAYLVANHTTTSSVCKPKVVVVADECWGSLAANRLRGSAYCMLGLSALISGKAKDNAAAATAHPFYMLDCVLCLCAGL